VTRLYEGLQHGAEHLITAGARAATAAAARNAHPPRAPKRVREQRNTTRWNRAAVRAALDA